jgi:PTS system mannose-specific IIA component
MIGVLIISHGGLADALISAAESLVGELRKVKGVSIWPQNAKKDIQHKIRQHLAELDDGDGVIILTDLLGGTPVGLSLSFLQDRNIEVVSGVNLPMLLAVSSYRRGKSLREVSKLVKRSGRRSIVLANRIVGLKKRA